MYMYVCVHAINLTILYNINVGPFVLDQIICVDKLLAKYHVIKC